MSRQDYEKCPKCGKDSGCDDGKANWESTTDTPLALCSQCKKNMVARFYAFFGMGSSYGREGLELEWPEVDKILSNIKRSNSYRVSYIVTDKECYQRTIQVSTPVETSGQR